MTAQNTATGSISLPSYNIVHTKKLSVKTPIKFRTQLPASFTFLSKQPDQLELCWFSKVSFAVLCFEKWTSGLQNLNDATEAHYNFKCWGLRRFKVVGACTCTIERTWLERRSKNDVSLLDEPLLKIPAPMHRRTQDQCTIYLTLSSEMIEVSNVCQCITSLFLRNLLRIVFLLYFLIFAGIYG